MKIWHEPWFYYDIIMICEISISSYSLGLAILHVILTRCGIKDLSWRGCRASSQLEYMSNTSFFWKSILKFKIRTFKNKMAAISTNISARWKGIGHQLSTWLTMSGCNVQWSIYSSSCIFCRKFLYAPDASFNLFNRWMCFCSYIVYVLPTGN